MAMFEKKVQVATKPLYTLGTNKTYLLVGLGNPGKKYAATRHNLGFMCLDHFAQTHEFPNWRAKKDLKSLISMLTLDDKRLILIKPITYMNNSGQAVRAVQQFYEVPVQDILAIHDELDIEFGQIRTDFGGGSAGHNGLNSLIDHIGEDFGRLRIGIGKPAQKTDGADYVLSKFSSSESQQLDSLKREVSAILDEYIHFGQLRPETRNFIL